MPIRGQLIGVYWWNDGGENTVEVYWDRKMRRFDSPAKAMAFLRTLPIDSYAKPTGRTIGMLPEMAVYVGDDPAAILDSAEKLMTPRADGTGHCSLFAHAQQGAIAPLFIR